MTNSQSSVWHAPAKLNLTLEVLGRRADGYHEIRSVVALMSLQDELTITKGTGFTVVSDGGYDASGLPDGRSSQNTVETALALMAARRLGLPLDTAADLETALHGGLAEVSIKLTKRIPAAAGLGGGTSDGATALQALNAHWSIGLDGTTMAGLALRIGSDCPLFLGGDTQLMAGRGERLQPLDSPAQFWCCVVDPCVRRERKTALLYGLLRREHFSNGDRSAALRLKLGGAGRCSIEGDDLCNAFDAIADEAFGDLDPFRRALWQAGAGAVHLCGAGPALYGLFGSEEQAQAAVQTLSADGYAVWYLTSRAP